MREVYGNTILSLGLVFGTTKSFYLATPDAVLPDDVIESINQSLPPLRQSCSDMGFVVSVFQIDRIIKRVNEKTSAREFKAMITELHNRIQDEMRLTCLLQIQKDKLEFYNGVDLFGSDVSSKFPSATFDIEEAGKCFALARNTACVMHLMRVIEIGLRAVATGLGIPQAELLPTWQAVISKIEAQMRIASNKRDADWLKIEPFYREIPAHLFAIKNAWRNPSMHVQTSYDEERALDIYNAVRGFMRYLATELSE